MNHNNLKDKFETKICNSLGIIYAVQVAWRKVAIHNRKARSMVKTQKRAKYLLLYILQNNLTKFFTLQVRNIYLIKNTQTV